MGSIYLWLKFIHILAGFIFLMSHGTSIMFAFKLKREKDLIRIQAMFDLSGTTWLMMILSLLVLLIVGVVLSFMGNWWSGRWIWVSLGIALGVTIWMFVIGQGTYHPMRKAFGLPYMQKGKELPAEQPASDEERAALIAKTRPWEMLIIALGGYIIIIWLMVFKPF
jgi:uncharacterized membrane protein